MRIRKLSSIECMTNLYPKRTGLPVKIWVDNLGIARNVEHNFPRVKIQNVRGDKVVDDVFEVSISKNPQILRGICKLSQKDKKAVFNFISEPCDDLIDSWNQLIDEDELKECLYIR